MRLAPLVPAPVRSALRRVVGDVRRRRTAITLAAMVRRGKPVVAGPWVSEVGFELLYWIPFLRWAVTRFGLDPAHVTAISRGGAGSWYAGVAGRYVDVLAHAGVERLREAIAERAERTGSQKQFRMAAFEAELLEAARGAVGGPHPDVLHPSVMYNLFRPFWAGDAPLAWALDHLRFAPLPAPPPASMALPRDYVAVKFYFNDGFPDTDANRALVARLLGRLADEAPVVSLATGLRVDDHRDCEAGAGDRVLRLPASLDAASNLAVQSAVVAGARRFVGTYGGFAYLAPLYGVPALAVYSRPGGFFRSHLDVAGAACAVLGATLRVQDAREADLDAVARPAGAPA